MVTRVFSIVLGFFGICLPLAAQQANRFATRLEANLEQTQAHNAVPSRSTLNLLAGLSVYSH